MPREMERKRHENSAFEIRIEAANIRIRSKIKLLINQIWCSITVFH